jgi:sterol desaturase/sphingolipid hydroxylase (fatty acid hydroxylase superfamily)
MNELLELEAPLRLGIFAGLFALVALWEWRAPRRSCKWARRRRWPGNLGVALLSTLLLRLVTPAAAVGAALLAAERGWGLFQQLELPPGVAFVASVLLLDLLIYFQHRVFHRVPLLWRLHRMHHSDPDFDVSTAVRFHPLEILLSMGIKMAAVLLLGAPATAVLVFELLLNATSVFNHGNLRLPEGVDRWLRLLIVTPDMHRVHHSVRHEETDSNFGFSIPWWDRLFGSYRAQPAGGHEGMRIGLTEFSGEREIRLADMLLQPLRSAPAQSASPTRDA